MDVLPIGTATTLTFAFKGSPVFPIAPKYNVYLANDRVLISGSSVVSSTSGMWDVVVTIPSTYSTEAGGETVVVEVYGNDVNGKVRAVEKEYRIIDASDDFVPMGVMVEAGNNLTDYLVLDSPTYTTELTVTIYDADGNVLYGPTSPTIAKVTRVATDNESPDRFSTPKYSGYKYTLTVPTASITFPTLTRSAHQLKYTLTVASVIKKVEIHSLYRTNNKWYTALNSLRSFLDKARLNEIDPTLQWQDDELCQSLIEGANYVNVNPPAFTYYTVDDWPQPLNMILWYAAALHALNARYLAEGFTAFEFSGLTTSLTVDRRDTITYKIEELKTYLETNLLKIKQQAVTTIGVGTAPSSVSTTKAIGALGISYNPASNAANVYRNRRGILGNSNIIY